MRLASLVRPVLVAAAAAVPCCVGSANGEDAPKEPEQVELRLHVKPGEVFWFRHTFNQIQTAMGMETTTEVVQEWAWAVRSVGADGSACIDLRHGRARGKLVIPMLGDVEFDSAKPATLENENPMIAMMLKSVTVLAGKSVEMTLDGRGVVTGAKGWAAVMKEAAADAGQAAGTDLDSAFTDESFAKRIGQLYPMGPDGSLSVGRKWASESALPLGAISFRMAVEHAVSAITADEVSIDSTAKIDVAKSVQDLAEKARKQAGEKAPSAEEITRQIETMKPQGTGTMKSRMSRKDGMPLSADSTTKMTMTLSQQGMEIEVELTQTQKLERLAREPEQPEAQEPAKPAEKPAEKPSGEPATPAPTPGGEPK